VRQAMFIKLIASKQNAKLLIKFHKEKKQLTEKTLKNPGNWRYHLELGEFFLNNAFAARTFPKMKDVMRMNFLQKAKKELLTALSQKKDHWKIYFNLEVLTIYASDNNLYKDINFLIGLSRYYLSKNNLQHASKYADQANLIAPENTDLLILLADIDFINCKYVTALSNYQTIFNKNPDKYKLLLNIALCFYNLGNYNEAEDTCLKVLAKHPDNIQTHILLAEIYQSNNQLSLLKSEANVILNIDRKNGEAYKFLGNYCILNGKYKDARYFFEKRIAFDNNNSEAYFEMGNLLLLLIPNKKITNYHNFQEITMLYEQAISYYEIAYNLNKAYLPDILENLDATIKRMITQF
jgi:tetratricopeptide (TPR) repeat protein